MRVATLKKRLRCTVLLFFVLALAGAVLLPACARKPVEVQKSRDELEGIAKELVLAMAQRDFEEARKHFDKKMSAVMSASQLSQVWDAIISQAGSWLHITGTTFTQEQGYRVVYVHNLFERGKLDIKVVFDSQGLVSGLWMGALQSDAYSPPTYANPDLFEERQVVVGEGKWALPGTLTIPKTASRSSPVPAVVLVHGSGPQDRDETIGPNKPFKDLAWGLASKGIAVLRYEKRTMEHGAKFTREEMLSLTVNEEIIEDALLAVKLLKAQEGIDPDRIFVIGHSLGATVGPRIALACGWAGGDGNSGEGTDPETEGRAARIAGLVMMAPAARNLADLMVEQIEYLASLDGRVDDAEAAQISEVRAAVEKIKSGNIGQDEMVLGAYKAYWDDLAAYDPVETAKNLSLPILLIQGERDYQVTMTDLKIWAEALSGLPNVAIKTYPELNHLFMVGTGKSTPDEYFVPSNVSEEVVEDVARWVMGTGQTR